MLDPIINYIPENIKLTDFRYQTKQIKKKLLEEKRVLLLVEKSKQLALLVPIDLLRTPPAIQLPQMQKKLTWPTYRLGKVRIPLSRKNIYEAF